MPNVSRLWQACEQKGTTNHVIVAHPRRTVALAMSIKSFSLDSLTDKYIESRVLLWTCSRQVSLWNDGLCLLLPVT
ncbi:hypothetical protein PISMIDRAFT_465470 [Pisolithus microcarpus 441]|uniref:Uncharacterized protein n=1 Tax=Pisolithus microcarpus 441 TaxID=765257 RepID=A0A0C9Z2G6_9AGAM|nr:hypothetical protein PISMIDRAFT_465470 [Pisolithus microcarpus 441]